MPNHAGNPIFAPSISVEKTASMDVNVDESLVSRLMRVESQCGALRSAYTSMEEDSMERLNRLEVSPHHCLHARAQKAEALRFSSNLFVVQHAKPLHPAGTSSACKTFSF
jgi:hypothetical protein